MEWIPGLGTLANPELGRGGYSTTRFQWMRGEGGRRRYHVRPLPPLPPPGDTHPINQPCLRQWDAATENLPQISIQDYRIDHDKIKSMRLPSDDPETGWVLGLPRSWKPQSCRDVKNGRPNFWGHFDYSPTSMKCKEDEAKTSKKGYPFLGISSLSSSNRDNNSNNKSELTDKTVTNAMIMDHEGFQRGYRVPPSAVFDFHYDSFPEDCEIVDEYKYEKDFAPPISPSVTDSETPLGVLDEVNNNVQRHHGLCKLINQLLMYCDQKLSYLRDCPPWHRVQIGVPALRIIQAIYTLCYLTGVRNHCLQNERPFCTFQKSTNWRNLIPFLAIYFGIALPAIPLLPTPSSLHWYRTFRSFNAVLFIIQTMAMAQISTAVYMQNPPGTQRLIYEYQFGLIFTSLFLIVYFKVKYDRQVENMPYWNVFTGCRVNKPYYWTSTYYGDNDTRGYLVYSSMIRQFHDIFSQARMNDRVWMRNHALLDFFILGYYLVSGALLTTLCQMSPWLKDVVGFFVFNFALGIGMSVFQLYWMHHIFCKQSFNMYHWGDIFMVATIT
ncbi:uncharacterized protein LOC110847848 isoform X2 [Folsomia candida]|uniref:uncharacterized protein LOC110847848 isoform X2 n=1 Tax=Folsomia candida TaxID=158441 RepID=UPI001604AF65|nr:uncharacterized protein LOC110847848 isoform X2 [Folsomia candida]